MSKQHYTVVPRTTCIDITVNAGEPLALRIPILDDHDQPVEITPGAEVLWKALAQVRRNNFSSVVLHEWATTGPDPNAEILPGPASAVLLTATADETAAWQDWPDHTCAWDLYLTEPPTGGAPSEPHRIAQGGFRVWPAITR